MGGKSTRIGTYKCYACRKPFTVKVVTALYHRVDVGLSNRQHERIVLSEKLAPCRLCLLPGVRSAILTLGTKAQRGETANFHEHSFRRSLGVHTNHRYASVRRRDDAPSRGWHAVRNLAQEKCEVLFQPLADCKEKWDAAGRRRANGDPGDSDRCRRGFHLVNSAACSAEFPTS